MAEMQYARAYTDASERGWADDKPGEPIPFVASTPGVKRDGLDLRASGWKIDNYQRSPVVLWCHDHKLPPIGTAAAEVRADRLRMPVVFDQDDPFAVQIESKVRRRIIRACSVGWDFVDADGRLLDPRHLTVEDIRDRAYYDLTELSIVPVGADPAALTERRRAALRSLSRELASLYDVQERHDSDATGEQIRAAVHEELERLGLDLDRTVPLPAVLESGPIEARVDERVLARAVRAAFADVLPRRSRLGDRIVAAGSVAVGQAKTSHPFATASAAELNELRDELAHTRCRAAIPPHDTAVEDSPWDGPGAVAACPADRESLRAIHAWVDDSADPNAKGSYALPHHAEPGGPANLAGVRNALARLPQSRIPESEQPAVERHLRNHLNAQPDGETAAADDTTTPDSAARAAAIDPHAARDVLAAFNL